MDQVERIKKMINMKPMSETVHTIAAGQVVFFETAKGIRFATQAKDRRENRRGKDQLNVVNVPNELLDMFINKLIDIRAERRA